MTNVRECGDRCFTEDCLNLNPLFTADEFLFLEQSREFCHGTLTAPSMLLGLGFTPLYDHQPHLLSPGLIISLMNANTS